MTLVKLICSFLIISGAHSAYAQQNDKFEVINGNVVQTQEALTAEELSGAEAFEEYTAAELEAQMAVAAEEDLQALIINASFEESILVTATLVLENNKYVLKVNTPNESYSCLASPGHPRDGGELTPKFQSVTPYNVQRSHTVSKRKSYAGAIMPWPVWLRDERGNTTGFAIHGGKVTGRRESHGCIRIACAQRFNQDVVKFGKLNTRVTVINN